jgi:serine/threonine-protein kinase 24/25/MST4
LIEWLNRDIKAGNILIGATGEVELADFGVAASFIKGGERNKSVQTFVGTPNWMAPEVVEHSAAGYNTAADIWSLGITALELAYGVAPYSDCSSIKVTSPHFTSLGNHLPGPVYMVYR